MTKSQIAEVLEEIATLLELKDENPFKIRAYANAARSLETFGGNLADLQDEEALAKIPGIGKAIAAKVKELASTGKLKYLEELQSEFPPAILDLFSISGLGAKKIKALYEQLHISSIEQLREACESGRVAQLPGFGETTQAKICTAIEQRAKHSGYFQFGQIAAETESLRRDLARLRLKRNRFEEIWRPIPMRSRPMSREVTGGEGKLCVMSILSSQRKSLGRLLNSSSNTRWRKRSLPK